MTKYELIFESLQEKINNNEISYEFAESVNELAYNKYITEDGHSKKVKARHNAKKKNIEKRFYDSMGYKHKYTDENGVRHGTVQRGDGPEVNIAIHNKNYKNNPSYNYRMHKNSDGTININKKNIQQKGSDLIGAHEYSHAIDDKEVKRNMRHQDEYVSKKTIKNKKIQQKIFDKVMDNKNENNYKNDTHKLVSATSDYVDSMNKDTEKEYKKVKNKLDKDLKKIVKKEKIKDKHDKKPEEVRADVYAVSTTKGENNSNRMRKLLNELSRRNNQEYMDKSNKEIRDVNKLKKELKNNTQKKIIDTAINITKKNNNKIKEDVKNKHQKRKLTVDNVSKKLNNE